MRAISLPDPNLQPRMKILIVIGTRPNFIKVTQFKRLAVQHPGLSIEIVHTGQHYDRKMSGIFFEQFGLQPDHFLSLRGDTAVQQFGNMITDLGALMARVKPDTVIVPGDVNSTLAGALAANRCGIKLCHLESGLRSFDRGMPEEINRILVDQITDTYFVTEQSGLDHLKTEGLDVKSGENQAHLVGNTMIDTIVGFDKEIQASPILEDLSLGSAPFLLMTMHRPSNVDNKEGLQFMLDTITAASQDRKVVLPAHPRTQKRCEDLGMWSAFTALPNLVLTEPMDYFAFQKLIAHADAVITDSGGIQEETTFRQVPCITLRPNTERPSTIELGTNVLIQRNLDEILFSLSHPKQGKIPPMWDGHATERILDIITA